MSNFSLEKYYLDAVTEHGDYFIGYFATLQFGPISLCYADTLHEPALLGFRSGPSFDCAFGPSIEDGSVTWRHTHLGLQGEWRALSPAFEKKLLSSGGQSVNWHVLQPSSQVQIIAENGNILKGLGSCERLKLTIPPWKLGLAELTWGRFVSKINSVVWLEWKGQHSLRLMYWNGKPVEPEVISAHKVATKDLQVSISDEKVLRSGTIGSEVQPNAPKVLELAPLDLLKVHEHKKMGRGVLQTIDGTTDSGWVIHEKVTWP